MKAVGRLDHPNIVRASDAGEHDGILYLVMDWVEGVDLGVKERIARLTDGVAEIEHVIIR